jgi:diguanylate cyclase (GGDEF)-like protein
MQIERKLKYGFVLALVLIFVNATAPFKNFSWEREQIRAIRECQHRISLINSILLLTVDAETGQRGFIITGKEEFLQPYYTALTQLDVRRNELNQDLNSSNEANEERQALSHFDQFIALKLQELAKTIETRRKGGFQAVEPLVSSERGKHYMDQIRYIATNLITQQNLRRNELRKQMERRNDLVLIMSLSITMLDISLLMIALYFVFRLLKERQQATNALYASTEEMNAGLAELERRSNEISLIGDMSRALEAPVSVKESFEIISIYCSKLLPHTAGILYLFRNSGDLLEKQASWGTPQAAQDVIEPHNCWALRRGQPHKTAYSDDLCCSHYKNQCVDHDVRLCLPLMAQGEVLGLIYIEVQSGVKNHPTLERNDEKLAIAISEQVALGLSNVKLREALRQQSIIDPLTGLFNRHYMEETLRRELIRAVRKSMPLSLIVLDVDHFKTVNDTFGHDAGDAVLRSLAYRIKHIVRESDVVCRFGGEEIVLILLDCDKQAAMARAQQINADVRSLDMRHGTLQVGRITLSAGIATCPENGDQVDALFHAADQALYEAKNTGRDRVVVAKKQRAANDERLL